MFRTQVSIVFKRPLITRTEIRSVPFKYKVNVLFNEPKTKLRTRKSNNGTDNRRTPIHFNSITITLSAALPIPIIRTPVLMTSSFLYLESSANLITASCTSMVKIGINNVAVAVIKSTVPNSDVVNTAVYKGTNKNEIIFEPKLLIVKSNIFLDKSATFCLPAFFIVQLLNTLCFIHSGKLAYI
ncbi:hypothetical protein FC74_GL002034 [Lacticaseibacillus paracasei subsp. paracasei ATCC 25302 = DSM 5622 = JCM 8130]|nr:hypothetical protein FC74_GL002034 [Lacticaseibacillus paracasei subsp. paracasei ATCC 25302 = DSM 5622 = JCM 8130]